MRSLLPASHLSCGGNSLRPKLDLVGASEASVMPAVFQSNSGCLKLLYRPSLTRFSAQRTPTSHVSRVAARSTQAQTFDALAGLLCPTELQIGLGTTNLGRGLVADRDLPAGTTLLTVDAFSTLCVVDEPLRTGDAFGAAVLSDWQAVWGVELPPLLVSYLRSSECCGSSSSNSSSRHHQPYTHATTASPARLQAEVTGSGAWWLGCCG